MRIGVAANFLSTATEVARAFEESTGQRVELAPGSSGQLVSQIEQGAPFHVFLSADSERPRRLEERTLAVAGSRFTYAEGRLALLCSPKVRASCKGLLGADWKANGPIAEFLLERSRVALAEPRIAPYGAAAISVLESLGIRPQLSQRLIVGQSVAQTYQHVMSSSVDVGFVALSQVLDQKLAALAVPRELHSALAQQAILLRDEAAARQFLSFLQGDDRARRLMQQSGYHLP